MAGAVLHAPLRAQGGGARDTVRKRDTTLTIPVGQRPDSALKDSLARLDSLRKAKRDTIKAPLARAELPILMGVGRRLYWNRDSVLATGAITLADLLERAIHYTGLHAGWIAAPAVMSYMGDVRRVRVFLDGVDYSSLDPRENGALDLTQINIWSVQDLMIEQTADEVRVYLRTWTVRGTTPETRTDVGTGDQATNLYRGYFGKRLDNGGALQFGAQQFGTTPPFVLGSSADQTGIIARLGWSHSIYSIDAFANRVTRHRGVIIGLTPFGIQTDSIPTVASTRTDSYLRFAVNDPDTSGVWGQVLVSGSKYDYTGVRTQFKPNPTTAADSAINNQPLDTNVFRAQYVASAGVTRGPFRVSGNERFFVSGGRSLSTPSVRASMTLPRLAVSAFLEGKSVDSLSHSDITAQFLPLSFITLMGSVGRSTDDHNPDSTITTNYATAQAGLRIYNLWLLGGLIRRDSANLAPPREFDTNFVEVREPAVSGLTAGIRGQLWRLLNVDAQAIRWNDATGFYRPRYETRSELYIQSNFLHRFPTNDFGLMASIIHEYRSNTYFPTFVGAGSNLACSGATFAGGFCPVVAPGYRTLSTLLEIRILSATISWQFRNVLGERYSQVPEFVMPRQTNFYGIRWSFFN